VQALAAPFAISPPAVTKHLKVLERAGLISRSRHAQWRPCRLEAKPLREAAIRAAVDLPFEVRPFPANSKRRGCSSWRSLLFPARSIR